MTIYSFSGANQNLCEQLTDSLNKLSHIPTHFIEECVHLFEYFYNIPALVTHHGLDFLYYFPFVLLHWAIRLLIAFPLEILMDLVNLIVSLVEYFNQLLFLMLEAITPVFTVCEAYLLSLLNTSVEYLDIPSLIQELDDRSQSLILGYCINDKSDTHTITFAAMMVQLFFIPALILRDFGKGLAMSHVNTTDQYKPHTFFTQTESMFVNDEYFHRFICG